MVEDVRPQPGFPRGAFALIAERPLSLAQRCALRDSRRGLFELLLVWVSLRDDAGRKRMRREDDVLWRAAQAGRVPRDEGLEEMPALDHPQLGTVCERV